MFVTRCMSRSVGTSFIRMASRAAHAAASPAAASEPVVICSVHGSTATLTLNRPKALNALNTAMLSLLQQHHDTLTAPGSGIRNIILTGAGGKAFCAGGDVKSLFEARSNRSSQETFFRTEYKVDYHLSRSTTVSSTLPRVTAVWDGVVMGGGVGISAHASARVVTPRTVFAMPETAIGLFPDVGASYFLSRMARNVGRYLGLTGRRVTGADVVHVGLGTHYVERVGEVQAAVERGEEALQALCAPLPAATLTPAQCDMIEDAFSGQEVELIVDSLKGYAARGDALAGECVAALARASPTSLKVTLEQLKRGSQLSLADCFRMEFAMALHACEGREFYEGVRALLVDKDGAPAWEPRTLEAVTADRVNAYFVLPPSVLPLGL